MKATRAVGLLIDLLLLAVSLGSRGSLDDGIRIVGLAIAGTAFALALALMILLAILLIDQRRPPYPM
jgi:hypothetical protein